MRINVLQHTPNEGPGMIQDWSQKHGHEMYIYHPYQFGYLPTAEETDLLVILGGPMSPNDNLSWIKQERDLIKEFIDKIIPDLSEDDDVDEVYINFENAKREEDFNAFADQKSIDEDVLKHITSEFEYSGILNNDKIKDLVTGMKLREKRQTKAAVASFVEEMTEIYS